MKLHLAWVVYVKRGKKKSKTKESMCLLPYRIYEYAISLDVVKQALVLLPHINMCATEHQYLSIPLLFSVCILTKSVVSIYIFKRYLHIFGIL